MNDMNMENHQVIDGAWPAVHVATLEERRDELMRDCLYLREWAWLPSNKLDLMEFVTDLIHSCLTGNDQERVTNPYALIERYAEAWAERETSNES